MRLGKAGIALGCLAVVAAAWSAAWGYAAAEAGRQVDTWLKAEATQGRLWTCPNRVLGGYPFALTLSCSNPTFMARAVDAQGGGQGVAAQLTQLTAEVALWHPRRVAVTLTPPFAYRTSDDTTNLGATTLGATWTALTLDLDGLPTIDALTLKGTRIALAGTFGDQGRQTSSAARLDTRITLPVDQKAPALGFDIAIDGMPIAALDQLVGGTAPADITLTGSIDRADVGNARTPEKVIETWREAGGQVTLASGRITREGAKVTASGALALDEAHRPKGKLDAQFVGLEPILARYGISGNLAAAGSLLSTLFGGGKPAAAPTEPGALSLPISLRNGHVGVGPIQTALEVPPLY